MGWSGVRFRALRRIGVDVGGGGCSQLPLFLERLRGEQGVVEQRAGLVWASPLRARVDRRRRGDENALSFFFL